MTGVGTTHLRQKLLKTREHCKENDQNAQNSFRWQCQRENKLLSVLFLSKRWEASVEKCEGSGCSSTGHTDSKRGAKSLQNSKTWSTASKVTGRLDFLYTTCQLTLRADFKMQQSPQSLCLAAHYERELLQYLANSMWLWSPPSLLARFDRLWIVLVSENEIAVTRASSTSCPQN